MTTASPQSPPARAPDAVPSVTPPAPAPDVGLLPPAFAAAVSGEWFGYECTFSVVTGSAQCIPEHYVPDEYRAWGVEIKGFECLTSSELRQGALRTKRTRVLPSVGCEADAVVPEISERFVNPFGLPGSAGFDCGSYATGPVDLAADARAWSFSLTAPGEAGTKRSRVRVEAGDVLVGFGKLEVFVETWDAPFVDGVVLPGCGGEHVSFADGERVEANALVGTWEVEETAYERDGAVWTRREKQIVVERDAEEAEHCIGLELPKGVNVLAHDEQAGAVVEAGWLVEPGLRVTVRREHRPDGEAVRCARRVERRLGAE